MSQRLSVILPCIKLIRALVSSLFAQAGKRKRKRSAESGASALVGGLATNKITTFLVEAEAEAALKSPNPHPCSEHLEKIINCSPSS